MLHITADNILPPKYYTDARSGVFAAMKIQVVAFWFAVWYCDRIPTYRRVTLHPPSSIITSQMTMAWVLQRQV